MKALERRVERMAEKLQVTDEPWPEIRIVYVDRYGRKVDPDRDEEPENLIVPTVPQR